MRLMLGIFKPRNSILGLVFAGEIEAVGKDIKRFKIGDQVYGLTGFGLGAYAEYKCMKEIDSTNGCLAKKPTNISYEEATAAAYGGLLAFQAMEKVTITPLQKVLVYGASGTSGIMAIQLAKIFGAIVTGVCGTSHLALVKSLGADEVIDYTKVDSIESSSQYDFILDAVGKAKTSPFKKSLKNALTSNGKFASIDDEKLLLTAKRLDRISKFIESGRIKIIMDKIYPLIDIVEAHQYVEKGHKIGGVAIKVI
jgi:NADPH:quinone reductase-like Zn-dependent oxidoreductase